VLEGLAERLEGYFWPGDEGKHGGSLLVVYQELLPSTLIAKVCRAVMPGDIVRLIILNERLRSDQVYMNQVMKAAEEALHQPVFDQLLDLGMTISDLIVVYLVNSVHFGHIDPLEGGMVYLTDWQSYAGETMWNQVSMFLDEQLIYLHRNGDPKQATREQHECCRAS